MRNAENERVWGTAWDLEVVPSSQTATHAALQRFTEGDVVEVGPGVFPRSPAAGTRFVEPIGEAVERLQNAGLQASVGRMEALGLPCDSVDTLLAFDVLEHVENDVCALAEASRVLRTGGHLVLAVPMGQRYFGPLDRLVGHTFRYEAAGLTERLSASGFEVACGYVWNPRFPIVKRSTDWIQWVLVRAVGLGLALRCKAIWMRRFRPTPLVFGPVVFTETTSRAVLVCRLRAAA